VSKVRSLVVAVAVVWLFVQVSVAAATTVLLITTGNAASALMCTCARGDDHGMCSVHQKPADSARCRMQSAQGELGAALLSMLGPLALPIAVVGIVPAISAPLSEGYDVRLPLDSTAPPDAPPPRG
jgi:hypothetical protein